jgi:hypothetical protein
MLSGMTPAQWMGIAVLAAAAGSLSGAAVVWNRTAPRAPAPAEPQSAVAERGDVDARLAALEAAISRLEHRSPRVIALPAPAAAEDAGAAPAPVSPTAAAVDDPVFEAAVRDIVQRIDEDRHAERQAERTEKRQAAAERWAASLVEPLHLTDAQKTKLTEIARDLSERSRDALADRDGGADPAPGERRAWRQALRAELEQKLAEVLDPSQLAAYQKLGDDLKFSARRSGRDRR